LVQYCSLEASQIQSFEGAIVVNGDYRYVGKKKTEIFYNIVFVVEEWVSYLPNIVTARSQHLLGGAVMWSVHRFLKKVKLSGGDHVANTRYVIEHLSDMFVVNPFCLYSHHQYTKDMPNVMV
jgi:hypothetical protein